MDETSRLDFALLLDLLWSEISEGRMDEFLQSVEHVMVDEYQDTNPIKRIFSSALQKTATSVWWVMMIKPCTVSRCVGGMHDFV